MFIIISPAASSEPLELNYPTVNSNLLQNGYVGKTRSLVGDAKFERLVRQETKKSLLEAARERSAGIKHYVHLNDVSVLNIGN